MLVYLLTLFILFCFALLEAAYTIDEQLKRIINVFIFLILVLQVGLRWETGTDWTPYLTNFNATTDIDSVFYQLVVGFETGYGFTVLLFKKLSDSYTFFLLAHACFYYFFIFRVFNKLTPYFYVSIFMLYCLTLGVTGSNRQLIALVICLSSIPFIIKRQPVYFFCLIALAMMFHYTSFFFCIYYFFNRKTNWVFLFSIALAFVIGKTPLPFWLFGKVGAILGGHALEKTEVYSESAKDLMALYSLSVFGLIKRVAAIAIFFYNKEKIVKIFPMYSLLLNGYIVGIIFYFLFSTSLFIMVSRGSLYFNIMEPLLIACQFCIIKRRENRIALIVVLLPIAVLFLYQSISGYSELFNPYKGIFINQEFKRSEI